ncbi:hypothetical protein [Synechococcus phage DSL-LC03]|nr:hypothetical protein [Synechococcus phage DSL-LC03]
MSDTINKGVELMLRPRRKEPKPKTFFIKFGKMVNFFRKEINIYFEFSLDIRDKRRGENEWNS